MGLRGSLAGIKLTDIFQMLAMSQQEQTLTVRRGHEKRIFYFSPGSISVILSLADETAMLGQILVGLGYLTDKEMQLALRAQSTDPRRVGEILVEMGICQQEQINEALKIQVESAIYDMLFWEAGTFEVTEGPMENVSGAGQRVICLSFDPSGLMMEAARRMDEWESIRQVIPSIDVVFYRSAENEDELPPEDGSLLAEKVFAYVDGQRRVREIVESCRLPAFDVCAALTMLLKQGRIRTATTEELLDLAQSYIRNQKPELALAVCEQVAAGSEGNEEVLARLGHFYEKLNYNERAAKALASAGKLLLDAARFSEAIDALDRASQLNRNDPEIKENLLSALNESGKVDRAISVARVLSQAFFKRGEYARARAMCQFILSHRGKDQEARFLLTEIHLATGNVQAAAAESNILAHTQPYGEDRHLKMLKSRIERLGQSDTRSLPVAQAEPARAMHPGGARGPLVAVFVVFLLLLVAGGGAWLWTERAAAQARGDVDRHAQELLLQKRYIEAIAEYETIVHSYPWTSTARELKRLVISLKLRQQQENGSRTSRALDDSMLSMSDNPEPRSP